MFNYGDRVQFSFPATLPGHWDYEGVIIEFDHGKGPTAITKCLVLLSNGETVWLAKNKLTKV